MWCIVCEHNWFVGDHGELVYGLWTGPDIYNVHEDHEENNVGRRGEIEGIIAHEVWQG